MFSTRLHVYTRASLTGILARILARKSRVSDKSADKSARIVVRVLWQAERVVAGHADILATILARKSARMSVSVSVSVSKSLPMEFHLTGDYKMLPAIDRGDIPAFIPGNQI